MATELWNRVEIVRPCTISTTNFCFSEGTGNCLKGLLRHSHNVLDLLRSKAFKLEVSVLHGILYSYNHRLHHHKPFKALKQVDQCLKRVYDMKLEAILEDLKDMCPTKLPKSVPKGSVHEVPSQPILEWFLLKLLGGCKLLLCAMDSCSKVFQLSVQFIRWEEYIVLNVVVIGMISRLWVLFQGVLQCMAALYENTLALTQEVSHVQQLPFVKDFTFPCDIASFLGPAYLEAVNMALPKVPVIRGAKIGRRSKAKLLDKLFVSKLPESNKREKMHQKFQPALRRRKHVDLGTPVLERRSKVQGELSQFDVKDLLRLPGSKLTTVESTKSFASEIHSARSFQDLTEQLKKMVRCFREKNLKEKNTFLRGLLLKCVRLKHLESRGYRLTLKMKCLKKSICKFLDGQILPKKCLNSRKRWSLKAHFLRNIPLRNKNLNIEQKATVTLHEHMPGSNGGMQMFISNHSNQWSTSRLLTSHKGLQLKSTGKCTSDQDSVSPSLNTRTELKCGPAGDAIDNIFARIGL
ncbi:nucleolus and neural progenitor protein [Erpetoichthys calabaricus]|uniref:Nucleolus and neural progenitor protein n=1 Tax=Erpetoichthys calabaricus TaxID=27687 RepID=A0A8C4X648_ERPCA|nr:nucleolus and neural progenitor protein [Erpetoichthys calabaricus]